MVKKKKPETTITKIPEHFRALEMVQQVIVIGAKPEFNPWDLGDGNTFCFLELELKSQLFQKCFNFTL